MNPTFRTKRLIVRPRHFKDLEQCILMDRDPIVTKHILGPWSNSVLHRAFVTERITTSYPNGLGYWSVINKLNNQNEFLGWVLLIPYDTFKKDEVEIGWRFTRKSWGHGYATEAASVILDHAFRTLKLEIVVADIHPENIPSIAVAEKLGLNYTEDRIFDKQRSKSYQVSRGRYLKHNHHNGTLNP